MDDIIRISPQEDPQDPQGVRIREGVEIYYGLHKTRDGLIRTYEEISKGKIEDITISGDFTFHPKEHFNGLEESLRKAPPEENQIIERVEDH